MKFFLILFSIFIVGSVCETPTAKDALQTTIFTFWSRLPQPIVRPLRHFFEFSSNHLDQKCPHSNENFNEVFRLTLECVKVTDSSLPVCTVLRTRLITCFEPMINITENCMPEKFKGVPTFIAKSTISVINRVCGLTGEQMFEYFNDCLTIPENEEDRRTLSKEIQDRVNKINVDFTVKNICSIGSEIKNLIKEYIKKSCSNPMTLNVFAETMDAFFKPCTAINEA